LRGSDIAFDVLASLSEKIKELNPFYTNLKEVILIDLGIIKIDRYFHSLTQKLILDAIFPRTVQKIDRYISYSMDIDHNSILLDIKLIFFQLNSQVFLLWDLPALWHLSVIRHFLQSCAKLGGMTFEIRYRSY